MPDLKTVSNVTHRVSYAGAAPVDPAPRDLAAWEGDAYLGRFTVVARQMVDTVTVIPTEGWLEVVTYNGATSLVGPEDLPYFDAARFDRGVARVWAEAVCNAAVRVYVAERTSISRVRPTAWEHLLRSEVDMGSTGATHGVARHS
jgi:hypothetical protein